MSRSLILAIAMILTVCSLAFGQTATGILQGRVSDATGASVPDAKLTIENERTAVRYVTSSNGDVRPAIPAAERVQGDRGKSRLSEVLDQRRDR